MRELQISLVLLIMRFKLRDAAKQRYEISARQVSETKDSLELKIKDLSEFITKEVKNLDNYCVFVNKKVDTVASTITRLTEDLTDFNNDYSGDLKVKSEKDDKVFEKIEKFLYDF